MEKEFEREVIERLTKLETLITQQDYARMREDVDLINSRSKSNETRLEKLEDSLKWIVRLVLGALILGILAFVYKM